MRPEDTKQMKRDWKTGAQNNNLMWVTESEWAERMQLSSDYAAASR